eukprot:763236-Hanusia_phi.AAC.3
MSKADVALLPTSSHHLHTPLTSKRHLDDAGMATVRLDARAGTDLDRRSVDSIAAGDDRYFTTTTP